MSELPKWGTTQDRERIQTLENENTLLRAALGEIAYAGISPPIGIEPGLEWYRTLAFRFIRRAAVALAQPDPSRRKPSLAQLRTPHEQ